MIRLKKRRKKGLILSQNKRQLILYSTIIDMPYYSKLKALLTKYEKIYETDFEDLEEFAGDTPIKRIIIDPSAASFKACIRKHKKFHILDADNSVIDGIRFTATLIAQGKLKIHEDCKETRREFTSYMWDEKRTEDAVIKEFDHSMDQMRYLCYTLRYKLGKEKKPQRENISGFIRNWK